MLRRCLAGRDVLAGAPEFSNGQVRIGALQEVSELMLALPLGGVKEPVISRVKEVVEIEHGAELHVLELADEQQGQGFPKQPQPGRGTNRYRHCQLASQRAALDLVVPDQAADVARKGLPGAVSIRDSLLAGVSRSSEIRSRP